MHQCNICKANFARRDNLTRHQNTVRCKAKDVIVFPMKRTYNNTASQKSIETSSTKKRRLDSEQESDDSTDIQFLPGDIEELRDRAKEILKESGN